MSMLEKIKKYMKDKKINFNGKFIVFVVAGIAVVTLNFSNYDVSKEFKYVDNSIFNSNEIVAPENHDQVTNDSSIEDQKDNPDENNTLEEPSTDNNTLEEPNINEDTSKENITNNDTENEQLITVYRSSGIVITLNLEEYLIGVVGSEMPASFNIEALKSQAIAARTYALNKINKNQSITDTTKDQVYKDNDQLQSLWGNSYDTYYNKVKQAVKETEGLILTYNNELIDAVYHSTSNGYTKNAQDVWGNYVPYLVAVESTSDKQASSYLRQTIFDYSDLDFINIDSNISISRDNTGNVIQIVIDNNVYSGLEFRNLLNLRSTDFDLIVNDNHIEIITKGYGHGVGMSQYGANGMANNGYNYNQILKHYYTGVILEKSY